ncbi:MAG: hypothetical protein KAK01_03940 [Candidatus Marinimicrobia bacterium]|nr:hypothetical protein [Candidatus Neomarinimicrobiota bacterium]
MLTEHSINEYGTPSDNRAAGPAMLTIVMSLVVKRASGADQDVNNIYELIDFGRELHE